MTEAENTIIELLQKQLQLQEQSNRAQRSRDKQGGRPDTGRPARPDPITSILNRLTVGVGGGARAFGLGSTIQDIGKLFTGSGKAVSTLTKLSFGFGAAASAAVGMTAAFNKFAQQLGGITPGQAFEQLIGNIGQSISGIFRGRILNPLEGIKIQGAFAQEFGGLISPQAAALLQEAGQDLGLNVGQLVKLERVLQGTGRESRATINEFTRIGVNAGVAVEELAKNGTAVARAGSNFNSFIVEGIKNAKRLGLEFGKIEQTLTGFATDFEGTVEGFANLRAVIPGFATDFNQLFSTALYGSTDDFIEQMRGGLLGAGITDISQLNRLQVAQLEKTTGFTGEQLNRILKGQEAGLTFAQELDTTRNSLLKYILAAMGAVLGAIVGLSIVTATGTSGISFGASLLALGATLGGAAVGGGLGYGAGRGMETVDDAIIQNGKIIGTNPADTIIATKTPEQLGTQQVSVNMSNLESKMDKLVMSMEQQLNVFRNGMFVEMRDMDKAIIRQQEATIRNY